MKLMKTIITSLLLLWGIFSLMIICGENTSGSIWSNLVVGGISIWLCSLLWRECKERNLLIEESDEEYRW